MARISYIYAFAGTRDMYRIVRYSRIDMLKTKITDLKNEIRFIWESHPDVESMYIVESEPWMAQEVGDILHRPSLDKNYAFMDYCRENGLCLMRKKGRKA